MAEINIPWGHGKEYANRNSMLAQLKKNKVDHYPYLVVTNPDNGKVRPVFVLKPGATEMIGLAHKGWMVTGNI